MFLPTTPAFSHLFFRKEGETMRQAVLLCGEITLNFLSNLFGQPKKLINFANLFEKQ